MALLSIIFPQQVGANCWQIDLVHPCISGITVGGITIIGPTLQCAGGQTCCTPDTACPAPAATGPSPFNGCIGNKINTAIGCIDVTDSGGFVGELFRFGIGIAGGIALLLILFGGFQILASAGNPEKLNAGKELVGSAIAGLLMIIFSTFLLKIIGVNMLCIPGFGSC